MFSGFLKKAILCDFFQREGQFSANMRLRKRKIGRKGLETALHWVITQWISCYESNALFVLWRPWEKKNPMRVDSTGRQVWALGVLELLYVGNGRVFLYYMDVSAGKILGPTVKLKDKEGSSAFVMLLTNTTTRKPQMTTLHGCWISSHTE